MNGHRYPGQVKSLRHPERVALLEVDRVVDLCLRGISVETVLDVGTGSGLFAEAFDSRGLDTSGVDVSPDMIEAARQFVPRGRFELAPVDSMPYSDSAFDLVFLGHVLHEAEPPIDALVEARRVARRRVGVLEWPYKEEAHGPPLPHRLEPWEVERLGKNAGFRSFRIVWLRHMVLYRFE